MRMYGEDRLDHTDLFNLYKSILEGAACSCCLRKKLGKDPPPPAPAGPEGSNDDPRPEPLDPQVPDGDDLPTGFCDDLAQQILNALGDGDFGMAGALQKIFDDLCDDGPGKQEPKPIPFPKPKPCPERKAA